MSAERPGGEQPASLRAGAAAGERGKPAVGGRTQREAELVAMRAEEQAFGTPAGRAPAAAAAGRLPPAARSVAAWATMNDCQWLRRASQMPLAQQQSLQGLQLPFSQCCYEGRQPQAAAHVAAALPSGRALMCS